MTEHSKEKNLIVGSVMCQSFMRCGRVLLPGVITIQRHWRASEALKGLWGRQERYCKHWVPHCCKEAVIFLKSIKLVLLKKHFWLYVIETILQIFPLKKHSAVINMKLPTLAKFTFTEHDWVLVSSGTVLGTFMFLLVPGALWNTMTILEKLSKGTYCAHFPLHVVILGL